ncbi:MAG: T9SS type A sorting domain-containing protein, partial [bacterium]
LLAANLDTNTYDPGLLAFNQYYTWRVVAKSPGGTEFPGDTWGFMTASSYAHTIRVPVAITNYCGPFGSSVVTIDIRIDGTAAPIDAGMLDLTYDPDLLTLFDFEPGDLTAGWQQFDYADLGTAIRIGGYNLDPIPIGSSGTYATLTFVSNCCGVDMKQSVALCPTNLTDDLRTLIPICGAYQCVFVTRDGDVNADSTVTPGDALCAFRGYLSFPVAPPGDCGSLGWEVRADVDCSNQVTPADALCIFHHALDGSCEFCNLPGLPTPVAAHAAQATAKISVGIPRNEGDELVLPLKVSLVEALDAFGFEIGYPAGDLEYLATDPAAPAAGFDAIDGLLIDEGRIRLGGYSATPIAATSPTDVVNLRFRKLATAPSGTITIEKFVDDVATAETVKWSFPPTNNDRRGREIVVMPNYPNPFNPVTEIRYEIPSHLGGVRVTLAIYNVEGRLIRKLIDEPQDAGAHGVQWNSRNDRGEPVSSGIYFYVLRVGEQTFKKKMVLLK